MSKIEVMDKTVEKVIIPLKQHEGAICTPLVAKGDKVLVGQKIGDCNESPFCASVHSSVAGEVISIEEVPHPNGKRVESIIVQPDEEQRSVDFVKQDDLNPSELIEAIKNAGIVENYGVPTHMVLAPLNKNIDTVIINATSSEWIQGDYSDPGDYASSIISSLKILMKAANVSKGAIVLRNDDAESINAFERTTYNGEHVHVAPLVGNRKIDYYFDDMNTDIVVVSQKPMYGKSLFNLFTERVTGRKVSKTCDPSDVGVAICGLKSAKAVHDAINDGKPFYETVIKVSGAVNTPQRILVKIGTPIKDVIEACEGYVGAPGKLIVNGPLTGTAQFTDEVPVTKDMISIYVQNEEDMETLEAIECIHCGRCVDNCPVDLVPARIATLVDRGRYDECMELFVMNCIECGKCSAVCPSKRHILQLIKYAKVSLSRVYPDAVKESDSMHSSCMMNGGQ